MPTDVEPEEDEELLLNPDNPRELRLLVAESAIRAAIVYGLTPDEVRLLFPSAHVG